LGAVLGPGCGDPASNAPAATRTKSGETTSNAGMTQPPIWLTAPCSVLSDAEMSALLPNPVTGIVQSQGLCEYSPTDLKIGRVDVELFIQDVAATGCDLFFSVGGFKSADPVSGIGSEARWKGNIKQLGVCVDGKRALLVTIYDPDRATEPLATARQVGELVISRLGMDSSQPTVP